MEDHEVKDVEENELDKNSQRNLIVTIVIIALVVIGFIAFKTFHEAEPQTIDDVFQQALDGKLDDDVSYIYNGYVFVNVLGSWMTRIKVGNEIIEIPLHYGPRDLKENISIVGEVDERFVNGDMFITFDPNSTQMKYVALSAAELSLNLAKGIKARPFAACTSNETVCEGRPIVTCDSTNLPVIYVKKDKAPMIVQSGNCVILMGNEWDMVRVVDRFLLAWYGIMP